MPASSEPEGPRIELLAAREREVLDLAIEGMTDAQVAQKMGIRVSTVSSYWVRVRGKIGQLSRTELVAVALRQGFRGRETALVAELALLRESEARARDDLAQVRSEPRSGELDPWAMLALVHAPAPCSWLARRAR